MMQRWQQRAQRRAEQEAIDVHDPTTMGALMGSPIRGVSPPSAAHGSAQAQSVAHAYSGLDSVHSPQATARQMVIPAGRGRAQGRAPPVPTHRSASAGTGVVASDQRPPRGGYAHFETAGSMHHAGAEGPVSRHRSQSVDLTASRGSAAGTEAGSTAGMLDPSQPVPEGIFRTKMQGLPAPLTSGNSLQRTATRPGGRLMAALRRRTLREQKSKAHDKGARKLKLAPETEKIYRDLRRKANTLVSKEQSAASKGLGGRRASFADGVTAGLLGAREVRGPAGADGTASPAGGSGSAAASGTGGS